MTIENLHRDLLLSWNARDAESYASLFAKAGSLVGFDGSMVDGRDAIRAHLSGIFADHEVATYVRIVRGVRALSDGSAVLRAVVGMTPPGQTDINPDTIAVQSLVAAIEDDQGRIVLFQNTPAAFHGRPDDKQRLVEELSKEGSL